MLLACALRSDCRMERELGHYLPTSYHPHTGPRASPLPPQTRPPLFPLLSCSDFFLRIVYASRDCADFIRGFMRTPPVPTLGPLLRPDPTQRISEENWRFHLLLIITVVSLSPIQFRDALLKKKTVKKGDIVPFWRPPPLNGSKGDICCLITDKSA